MKRWIAMSLVLSACGDPKLDVTFQIGPQYRDAIASATLRIYEPRPAAPITCDMLAFGQVDEDVLRISLVSEISLLTTSEAPLEVDRAAAKLFWADGIDGGSRRIVTGCAEQGEVDSDTEVVIDAEPTKLVTVQNRPSLSVETGGVLDDPIVFKVTDLDERALSGVEVRWEIDGAGGSGSNGSVETDDIGTAAILPTVPTRPGPFVLDVAIRWAEQDPEPVGGFVTPAPEMETLNGRVVDYRGGTVGPNAEPGFAALIEDGFDTYKVAYVYQNMQGDLQTRYSQSVVATAPKLGLIEPTRDGERARAIIISLDAWDEINVADGSVMTRSYTPPAAGFAPVEIEMSGSCEPGSPPQIFVSYESNIIGIFNDQAQGDGFTLDYDLIASGCVTDEVGGTTRLLIVADAQSNLAAATLVEDTLVGQPWLAVPTGIGFAPPIGEPRERLLLGTQLSVNDVVISRFVIRTGNQTLELVQRDLDSPTGFPLFTDGGDIDGDGTLDIVSLLDQRTTVQDPPKVAVWSSIGREREGRRITGEFEVTGALSDPEMIVVDFDHDGSDDVIIGERTEFDPVTTTRFEVFPMGQVTPR